MDVHAIALLLAVLGAVGYGAASVLEAVGAGRGAGTLATLAAPAYLAGLALDLLAWLASLVALRSLPVYQVQAILAGSLAVTVLLAWFALGHRLRRADLAAIAVTVAALIALAASAGAEHPSDPGHGVRLGLALASIAVALLGWATARAGLAAGTGAMAGLAFGGAALCARAVRLPGTVSVHALTSTGSDPLSWGLLAFGLTGMLLYAHALEHGAVGPVTALLWIAEVVAPSVAGAVLLADRARPGWLPVAGIALVAAVVAAVVLAGAEP